MTDPPPFPRRTSAASDPPPSLLLLPPLLPLLVVVALPLPLPLLLLLLPLVLPIGLLARPGMDLSLRRSKPRTNAVSPPLSMSGVLMGVDPGEARGRRRAACPRR